MDRLSPIDVLDATHHIGQLRFSGIGARLVSRGRPVGSVPEPDSQLNLWRLNGSRYERLQLPTGRLYVRDVALDHPGKRIALTGFDGEKAYRGLEWGETPYRLERVIQLWDGDSHKKTFERPADETHLIRFSRTSDIVILVSKGPMFKQQYEVLRLKEGMVSKTRKRPLQLPFTAGAVPNEIDLDFNGDRLVVAGGGHLAQWRLASVMFFGPRLIGLPGATDAALKNRIERVCISDDGNMVACRHTIHRGPFPAGSERLPARTCVVLFDGRQPSGEVRKCEPELDSGFDVDHAMAFNSTGQLLAIASGKDLVVLETTNLRVRYRESVGAQAVAFAPTTTVLAAASGSQIRLLRLP